MVDINAYITDTLPMIEPDAKPFVQFENTHMKTMEPKGLASDLARGAVTVIQLENLEDQTSCTSDLRLSVKETRALFESATLLLGQFCHMPFPRKHIQVRGPSDSISLILGALPSICLSVTPGLQKLLQRLLVNFTIVPAAHGFVYRGLTKERSHDCVHYNEVKQPLGKQTSITDVNTVQLKVASVLDFAVEVINGSRQEIVLCGGDSDTLPISDTPLRVVEDDITLKKKNKKNGLFRRMGRFFGRLFVCGKKED